MGGKEVFMTFTKIMDIISNPYLQGSLLLGTVSLLVALKVKIDGRYRKIAELERLKNELNENLDLSKKMVEIKALEKLVEHLQHLIETKR